MVQHNCDSRARRSRNTGRWSTAQISCDNRARKDIVMANKTQSRHGAMVCGTAVAAEPEEQNVRAAPEGMYIYTYLRLFSATTLLACTGVELTAWRSPRQLQALPVGRQGLATFATTLLAGTGVAARRSPRRLQAVPAGMPNATGRAPHSKPTDGNKRSSKAASVVCVMLFPTAAPNCRSVRTPRHRTTSGSKPCARSNSAGRSILCKHVIQCPPAAALEAVRQGRHFRMEDDLLGDDMTSTATHDLFTSTPLFFHFRVAFRRARRPVRARGRALLGPWRGASKISRSLTRGSAGGNLNVLLMRDTLWPMM